MHNLLVCVRSSFVCLLFFCLDAHGMLPYPAVPLLLLLQEAALKAVEAPLLFLCAESDFTFGPKVRTRAQELLEEKSPGEFLCTVWVDFLTSSLLGMVTAQVVSSALQSDD